MSPTNPLEDLYRAFEKYPPKLTPTVDVELDWLKEKRYLFSHAGRRNLAEGEVFLFLVELCGSEGALKYILPRALECWSDLETINSRLVQFNFGAWPVEEIQAVTKYVVSRLGTSKLFSDPVEHEVKAQDLILETISQA